MHRAQEESFRPQPQAGNDTRRIKWPMSPAFFNNTTHTDTSADEIVIVQSNDSVKFLHTRQLTSVAPYLEKTETRIGPKSDGRNPSNA